MRAFPKKVTRKYGISRENQDKLKESLRGNVKEEESVTYYSFKRLACSEVVLKDCLLVAPLKSSI